MEKGKDVRKHASSLKITNQNRELQNAEYCKSLSLSKTIAKLLMTIVLFPPTQFVQYENIVR